MKSFILMFLGFLFIMCPFTIIIGIYLIDKGLNEIEKEIKNDRRKI